MSESPKSLGQSFKWRAGLVVFGLVMMIWGTAGLIAGQTKVGWRHGASYEVAGTLAYVAASSIVLFGLSSLTLGITDRNPSRPFAYAVSAGMLAWLAVLMLATFGA